MGCKCSLADGGNLFAHLSQVWQARKGISLDFYAALSCGNDLDDTISAFWIWFWNLFQNNKSFYLLSFFNASFILLSAWGSGTFLRRYLIKTKRYARKLAGEGDFPGDCVLFKILSLYSQNKYAKSSPAHWHGSPKCSTQNKGVIFPCKRLVLINPLRKSPMTNVFMFLE